MVKVFLRLIYLVFLGSSTSLWAKSIVIEEGFSSLKLGPHLELAVTSEEELPTSLSATVSSLTWKASQSEVPNLGYRSGSLWARVELHDRRAQAEALYLELTYAQADLVDVFDMSGNQITHLQSGDHRLMKDWAVDSRFPTFRLEAARDRVVYLRLAGQSSFQLPLSLSAQSSYFAEREKQEMIQALYYGALVVMLLYNTLLWIGTKIRIYGLYVLYLLGYMIFQLALNGHGYRHVWPDAIGFADSSTILGILIFANASLWFSRELLEINQIPQLARYLQNMLLWSPLLVFTSLIFINYRFAINLLYLGFVLPWLGLMIYVSMHAIRRRDRIARWYVISWSIFLTGCFLALSQRLQILPSNIWTTYGIQVGSVLEFLLFSFALAERIKILQEKVQKEQSRVLEIEKIAHAAAEHALQQERDLSTQREYLLANTSHELRTPLNGIMGYLELVLEDRTGHLPGQAKIQIHKALRLAESLKYQVNTILDLSKVKSGELSLTPHAINLADLMGEADTLAEGLGFISDQVAYNSSLQTEKTHFIGDREKIFTIIRNLLGNAFKFRAADRKNRVALTIHCTHARLHITVEDCGIGIDPKDHEAIFQDFFQIQRDTRRAYEGTGLGLSLVKKLVTLMGGTLQLTSELGQGSTFTVIIPERDESELDILRDEERIQVPSVVGGHLQQTLEIKYDPIGAGYSIFIIDDHQANCDVIGGMLRAQEYEVEACLSGAKGLELMRANPPDLLILDMMLPEVSGEDVMRTMHDDPILQEIPVIIVTAGASEHDRIHALSLGADDYLPKPVNSLELRLRVRNLIHRHELLRQIERGHQELKMVQMGEMFGDLSHELKNILFGSSLQADLEKDDALLAVSVLSFSETTREIFIQGLLSPIFEGHLPERLQNLQLPKGDLLNKLRRQVRLLVAEMNIPAEDQLVIWSEILNFPPEELHFTSIQLKLFMQNKQLLHTISRCRDFTQSILTFSRDDRHNFALSSLQDCWQQTKTMVNARLRKNSIQVRSQLTEQMVSFPASQLLQILLNLTINALDAVEDLLPAEKWIAVESKEVQGKIVLMFSNGGAPIPREIHEKIFERGFSTKGRKGNGLGLYLAKRLLHKSGGELLYNGEATSPCFHIILLRAEDHALKTGT